MGELRRGSLWFKLSDWEASGDKSKADGEASRRGGSDPALALQLPAAADPQREYSEARFRQTLLEREEQARSELNKLAEISRVRIEADTRAQIELLERRHAHQLSLIEMARSVERRSYRTWVGLGFGLASLILGLSLGLYYGKLQPETARLETAYEKLAEAERMRADKAERLLTHTRERQLEATKKPASANSGATSEPLSR